ncbi:MAG TPA: hypothetical protein VGE07_10850, partial [Herpetosiphonaceae bacterium]
IFAAGIAGAVTMFLSLAAPWTHTYVQSPTANIDFRRDFFKIADSASISVALVMILFAYYHFFKLISAINIAWKLLIIFSLSLANLAAMAFIRSDFNPSANIILPVIIINTVFVAAAHLSYFFLAKFIKSSMLDKAAIFSVVVALIIAAAQQIRAFSATTKPAWGFYLFIAGGLLSIGGSIALLRRKPAAP